MLPSTYRKDIPGVRDAVPIIRWQGERSPRDVFYDAPVLPDGCDRAEQSVGAIYEESNRLVWNLVETWNMRV